MARFQLSSQYIQQIVDKVFVQHWTYHEVAISLRVKVGLVTRIVKAYRNDPALVEQLRAEEASSERKVELVQNSVAKLFGEAGCIRKLSVVQNDIEQSTGQALKSKFVSGVMRRLIGLKYSRIRRLPFKANKERCLVLRHLYARQMLELLSNDARIFNIDESWLNDLSYN
ncbi:MAG: hypothetical protein VYC68_04610 [Candidatus Thermoplasmatota archaeon]|nr:hypothetical protein [Candidatus Thermoplasmatota archaeon]